MSAPAVLHSFPAVDAVNTPQPLRNRVLRTVVEHAQGQLMQLMQERQQISQKIAILKRTIKRLVLLNAEQLPGAPNNGANRERRRGLANACLVLTRSDTSLSAQDIFAILRRSSPISSAGQGIKMHRLSLPQNRLEEYGEADTFLRNRSRLWQRQQSVDR